MEQFSTPLSLAFTPVALPDEIFGSWLGRVAAYNGLASKAALLRWLGVPKPLRRISLADIVPGVDSVHHVLSALGLEYKDVLSRMSTRPYWESMHSVSVRAIHRGGSDTKHTALLTTYGGRSIADKHLSETFFKICPACLEEDIRDSGASYFHRSHQLMGTRICYKHGTYLLSNCPVCAVPLGDTGGLLGASLHCACATALLKFRRNADNDDPWWRLATFEHHCLIAGNGVLSGAGMVGYLREQLKEKFPSAGRFGGLRALESTFGKDGASWLQRNIRGQITEVRTKAGTAFSLTEARVAVYAGLFVACNITFDNACREVQSYAQREDSQLKLKRIRNAAPTTCEEARSQFLQYVKRSGAKRWKDLRSTRPHVYWLLTFQDAAWLDAQMPPRNHPSTVPSIDSDREVLAGTDDFAKAGKLSPYVRHAAIRALYRDKAWLDSQIDALRRRKREEVRELLIRRLEQVRVDHLATTSRPKRFSRGDASRGIGTTVKTLLSQAERFDVPPHLIEEDLAEFRRRALKWAVEQRLAKGLSLAPSMVRLLAGLGEVVSLAAVTNAIEEVTAELSRGADQGNL